MREIISFTSGIARSDSVPGRPCGDRRTYSPGAVSILLRLAMLAWLVTPAPLQAGDFASKLSLPSWDIEYRSLYSSFFTEHYDPEPEHNNEQNMLGFEVENEQRQVMGIALFDNSFGQDSQYLYLGRRYRAMGSDHWYYKVTAGLLHGYQEPYEDKIPLNDLGIAPVIIPGIGYRNERIFVEFAQLGLAAGMLIGGFSF